MLLDAAYKVPAGSGVGKLGDAPQKETPRPAPQTTQQAPETKKSALEKIEGWAGWAIAAAVALLVIVIAAFSLLRH